MKKIYKKPQVKLIEMASCDIICTSNGDNTPRWLNESASDEYESL